MFGISGFELLLIAAFALIIFGPDKLPEFGRTAGRFMRDFKRTQEEMEAIMKAEMYGEKKPGKSGDSGAESADMEPDEPAVSRAEEWADDDEEEEEEEE